jgi:hypothetical protein
MGWPFRSKEFKRAAMAGDVLLAGRERDLARERGHDASMGFRGDAQTIQPVRHMVPEPAANSYAVWAIKRLLANATQAANIALTRLAVDTYRLDQNGVPVDPALQPSSLLPSRKHAVV